jgi:parallel beta-helix repeat protein
LAVTILCLLSSVTAVRAATVTLSPGTNIQAAINSQPVGTTFVLMPGTYRGQSLVPKSSDKFNGQSGADLNGSQTLTLWSKVGNYWVAAAPVTLNHPFGPAASYCQSVSSGCAYPQDLYVNNEPLVHQLSLPISAGQWYFNYTARQVYLAQNPAGQIVELGVTPQAFSGNAANVTVQNLIVEKYATTLQTGTIGPTGPGWIIQNNEVRLNHGEGIKPRGANNTQILGNNVHNNGQVGIAAGAGSNLLVQSNTISGNNYSKILYSVEAGGLKIATTTNAQVINNTATNNDGNGLWVDSQGTGTVFNGNKVSGNSQNGIRNEYSDYSTIVKNTLINNGQNSANAPCNANIREIVATDSNHVSISGNTITSKCAGITLTQGTNRTTINYPTNLVVTDNTISYSGSTAIPRPMGGLDSETPPPLFQTQNDNYFDYNTYRFSSTGIANLTNWIWAGSSRNWAQWRAAGQDIHGTVQ